MNIYPIPSHGMISGFEEAENKRYMKIETPTSIWLIADVPNSADYVYYRSKDSKLSEGFAGSTLKFTLIDGSIIELQGPWHANADSLFAETGFDIRNKHLTFTVIAKERTWENNHSIYQDVLYEDKKPTIGYFNRGKYLAEEIADVIGKHVMCYMRSAGGASDGPVYPKCPHCSKRHDINENRKCPTCNK